MWWLKPVIPALGRLGRRIWNARWSSATEFTISLGYVIPYLRKKKITKMP